VEEIKMKDIRNYRSAVLAVVLAAILIVGSLGWKPPNVAATSNYPGTLISALPNYAYPPMVFTATSQTRTQILGGVSTATIRYAGTQGGVSTVTFEFEASNDGGQTWFPIPYTTGAVTATYNLFTMVAGATVNQTAATPALYYVNLAGFTNFEIVSSSTFTSANGTSTTPLTIGLGTQTLTTGTGLGYTAGNEVVVFNTGTPANYMAGTVTSYTTGTGVLVMNVNAVGGSGSYSAWTLGGIAFQVTASSNKGII
jgi:hypothetical protein